MARSGSMNCAVAMRLTSLAASSSLSAVMIAVCNATVMCPLSNPMRLTPSSLKSSGSQPRPPLMRSTRKSGACSSACSV